MENENASEVTLGSLGTGSEVSSTFQLELSEYGNPVPFKVIKLEQDADALDIFAAIPEGFSSMDHAGTSKLSNEDSSSSVPLGKRVRTSLKLKYSFDNDISSEEGSSESDMDIDMVNSENDSELEEISDSDDTIAPKNEVVPDVLDHAGGHENEMKIPNRPPTPEWSSDPTPMKKIEFTKKQGLSIASPQTPYEALRWFLNDEVIVGIIQETNKNAARLCNKSVLAPKSRYRAWKDVNRDEIFTFIALLLHTGTFRMNRYGDYWKKECLFNWTCFSHFMKRNRFMLIFNCLSFGSPTNSRDVIGKFSPIVQNFNQVMSEIYNPGKELFLPNPMVLWYGRLVRQEHRDYSRCAEIIHLYKLADSNGIVLKYQVYAGDYKRNVSRITSGEIVTELLDGYLGYGHAVYMNRCYSSWKLAAQLLHQHTYCTGILSKNSRDNLFTETVSDVSKQSYRSLFLDGINIGKWVHKKPLFYISTEFNDECKQVTKKDGTKTTKPIAILNYNKHMIDSELQEQLMSYYPCSRKALRWNKKMFIHTMQIYMNNAYHLYNNYSGKEKLSFHDFRVAVLKAMLPKPRLIPQAKVASTHVLTKVSKKCLRKKTDKSGQVYYVKETARKHCIVCRQNHVKNGTVFECRGCKDWPAFCPSCFCHYHSDLSTKTT